MPSAIITGGAGFIGSNLAAALVGDDWRVTVIDDLSHGLLENLGDLPARSTFKFVHSDIRRQGLLESLCADVDCIIHLAAFKIPRYGDVIRTLNVNNEGTRIVLECAARHGIKTIVASTSDVYGKNPHPPFTEQDDLTIGPSSIRRWAYAASKIFDEHLCLAYFKERELPVTVLRFFGSYGPNNHRSWWGGPQAVFIEQALRNEPLTIHGDGKQTRSFCYISDTIAGIRSAMECTAAVGQIINIGSVEEIEIAGLAELIIELTGSKSESVFVPYESFGGGYEDVRRRTPDISKAGKLLGFRPTVDLRTGLEKTIAWHRLFL